jgi:putative nucleotidyltransferase with HDIG domain
MTSTTPSQPSPIPGAPAGDPVPILKAFAALRRITGTYPDGHPIIAQKVRELEQLVRQQMSDRETVQIEMIHGDIHADGLSFAGDVHASQMVQELSSLGVQSVHIRRGVTGSELHAVAQFLWDLKEAPVSRPFDEQLSERGVGHVSLGRLVPLDTRWRTQQWPDSPQGPIDPAYAETLLLAQQAFDSVQAGRRLNTGSIQNLVHLLIHKVAQSNVALGQILAIKQYENLTYCHSVNVATLSLLLGRRLGLDEAMIAALVEAAVLHDIGKTRVPLEVVKKPGVLDTRERRLIESHTTLGAEILVQIDGLRPLTPVVALEHHRTVKGSGYPDLGEGTVPHLMSQIVSVADIYEALTGARSYQAPMKPERACLVLARLAGEKLNTALVKAFVNVVTFFPLGSLVRTNREELGVVIRTNPADPLHPVISVVSERMDPTGELDTSARDAEGQYERHVLETLKPQSSGLDLSRYFTELSSGPLAGVGVLGSAGV